MVCPVDLNPSAILLSGVPYSTSHPILNGILFVMDGGVEWRFIDWQKTRIAGDLYMRDTNMAIVEPVLINVYHVELET